MIIKSLNSGEIEKLKALPSWVKKSAKLSTCFFTVLTTPKLIEVDNNNSQDLKDATDEFNKLKRETPDVPIYLIGMNPLSIINLYHPTFQLPRTHWPEDFAKKALEELKNIKMVSDDLDEDDWLYIFGYATPDPQSTVKIQWLGSKELFRLFLEYWYEEEYISKRIKRVTYINITPFCFLDSRGNPMHLSKAREEDGPIPALIKKIFRPNENN